MTISAIRPIAAVNLGVVEQENRDIYFRVERINRKLVDYISFKWNGQESFSIPISAMDIVYDSHDKTQKLLGYFTSAGWNISYNDKRYEYIFSN